jgi:hypothetical protein
MNPDGTPQAVALNPAAQRRPSDRLIPGDGTTTTTPPVNPQQDNGMAGVYPPNYNPTTFNPNDPSTWPPITLAPVNAGQSAQPGQNGQNGQPVQPGQPNGIPGFGGQNALNAQQSPAPITSQPFGQTQLGQTQPFGVQIVPPTTPGQQTVPGQPANGQPTITTPLPFGPQPAPGSDGSAAPQAPYGIQGQSPVQGGVNPQPAQIYNPGFGFNGNPLATDPTQQPAGVPATNPFGNSQQGIQPRNNPAGQQNPAALNPALQQINNQLASPNVTPAGGANPQSAPGIAGVASTFEGVGIKIYHERSKYKEWEFVFDPAAAGGASQQLPGQNGQPAQGSSTPSGAASPFGQTSNPFAPNSGQTSNPFGQAPGSPAAPATNPFAPTQGGPFGQ